MINSKLHRSSIFKIMLIFIVLILSANQFMSQSNIHTVPQSISKEASKALSYFPELKDVDITFKFKTHIKKSTMQAQPKFGSFFRSRSKRSYVVLINKNIKIADKEFRTEDIPKDVMIGWLGHELGHIIDYQKKSNLELLWFGVTYLTSDNHIKEAERAADTYAVSHGMADYILKTKNFILNHAEIDDNYKMRIKKYYLSPEEIMAIVEKVTVAD